MNKSDLMNRLAEEKGFPLSTAKEIVDIFFDDMTRALIKRDRVEITEEPDVWEIRLSGSERGRGTTEGMAEIKWHRRETRRQTEKTNFSL